VENHGDDVLGQEFPDIQGSVDWRIIVVQKPGNGRPFVRPFPTNCISKALQNGYVDSLIHGLALGKKLVMHQALRVKESAIDGRPVCGSSSMDVRPFLNREYHSNVLERLNAVSPNACCSISYVSVAVLPSFWQMHVAPSTNPFHNTTEGQTRLHCRSTHSRLSQAAIRSYGMWRQVMSQVSYMVVTSILLVLSP
jgi:hypothetical protein